MNTLGRLRLPMGFLLLSTAASAFQATVVPTDIQLPGTQPLEVSAIQDPSKCDNCHGGYAPAVEPAHNWRGSMMAHAGRDPLFWATVAVAEQDFPGAGDLCVRCHSPEGWNAGRSTPTDGSGLAAGDDNGVNCDVCHRLTNPDTSEWLGVQNAPFLAYEGLPPTGWYGSGMAVLWAGSNEKIGPYDDAQATHGTLASSFHRSSELCGTCHDVSNSAVGDLAPNHGAQFALPPGSFSGVPGSPVAGKAAFNNPPYAYGVVERTFSEHMASGFPTLRVSSYGTLPAELKDGAIEAAWSAAMASSATGDYKDGEARFFTCQTCHMPPVTGKGCNKNVPVRTDLPAHDLVGASAWMVDALQLMDAQGELVLGGGMSAAEVAGLQAGKLRALANLSNAASLQVTGNTLRVVNLTGHKLISGYPEGRRMWVRARWYDAGGALLREDGGYGPLAVQHDGAALVVNTLKDLHPANTRLYEARFGVSQAWAAKLIGWGWDPSVPLEFDRVTGAVSATLGQAAAAAPGSVTPSFHFVLNDTLIDDPRIPPWGFSRDEAALRNTLPVPATQYGNPGPGGTYRHWDEIALAPPAGAVQATLELLYQSTSWEYLQFLDLANEGGSAFLASTGEDLLEAWLATGMAEPHVMASATWTGIGPPDPWTTLGFGLAGIDGIPQLAGAGTLVAGTPGSLLLTQAAPAAPALLFMSFAVNPVPFKGGTLVTVPPVTQFTLATNGAGTLLLPWAAWPAGIPAGTPLVFQYAIQDAAAVQGVSLSHALKAVTP